ncbi:MAG TPA: DUF732 domain-containing protein [Mycobacterium sp.]|nr:MAG: DUF732 domain-containing protein [Mycobacterium sp.]HOB49523.1 DUF732 domain-containing protein [Mycobacterium sp.]HPZ94827.1 DUF732 domain-containing protein [Mycobacterium sp.]HQE16139.1 DUF732 domain-containing protein [Mycobacterium sp.]
MKFRRTAMTAGLLAGLVSATLSFVAPAQADTGSVEDLLGTLDGLGITDIAPQDAVALGQSLCPLLADRSQNSADIAAQVADALGRPLGAPTAFTGMAVSFLCPKAVDRIAEGGPLLPLFG